jgi:RND family efflux transporter MFP subunit
MAGKTSHEETSTTVTSNPSNSPITLFGLVAVGLLGLVVLMMFSGSGAAKQDAELVVEQPVLVFPIAYQSQYAKPYRASGKVESNQQALVGFENSGKVAQIFVEDGAEIIAGQVLANLDTQRLKAQLNELIAARSLVEAEVRLAQNTKDRIVDLATRELDSVQRLDEVSENLNITQARLTQINAQIASLRLEMEKSTISASANGSIIKRMVDPGAVVAVGQPIFEIASTTALQARIPLPPHVAKTLSQDDGISLNIGNNSLNSQLSSLGSQRNLRTRTLDALFNLPANADILVGDLVTANLTVVEQQTGAWIPVSALASGVRGMWTVLVAHQIGQTLLESRTVEIIYTDGEMAYVSGAIADNELVVLAGTHRFIAGQKVRADLYSKVP